MAALSDGDLLEFLVVSRCNGQNGLMVRHALVQNSITGGVTDYEAVAALSAAFATKMKACMSQDAEYQGISMKRLSPNPTDPVTSTVSAGAGASAFAVLPLQSSGLIALKSGFAGRSKRGRTYVPFPSEGFNDANGVPNASYGTVLSDVAGIFTTPTLVAGSTGSASLLHVVHSKKLGLNYPVAQAGARSYWATQRRRSLANRGDQVVAL